MFSCTRAGYIKQFYSTFILFWVVEMWNHTLQQSVSNHHIEVFGALLTVSCYILFSLQRLSAPNGFEIRLRCLGRAIVDEQ